MVTPFIRNLALWELVGMPPTEDVLLEIRRRLVDLFEYTTDHTEPAEYDFGYDYGFSEGCKRSLEERGSLFDQKET